MFIREHVESTCLFDVENTESHKEDNFKNHPYAHH